jgi:hypothetical protein
METKTAPFARFKLNLAEDGFQSNDFQGFLQALTTKRKLISSPYQEIKLQPQALL